MSRFEFSSTNINILHPEFSGTCSVTPSGRKSWLSHTTHVTREKKYSFRISREAETFMDFFWNTDCHPRTSKAFLLIFPGKLLFSHAYLSIALFLIQFIQ